MRMLQRASLRSLKLNSLNRSVYYLLTNMHIKEAIESLNGKVKSKGVISILYLLVNAISEEYIYTLI